MSVFGLSLSQSDGAIRAAVILMSPVHSLMSSIHALGGLPFSFLRGSCCPPLGADFNCLGSSSDFEVNSEWVLVSSSEHLFEY